MTSAADISIENRIKYLEKEWEIARMQLVACGVATFQNTEKTCQDRLKRTDKYWSVPYADVCNTVDREMRFKKLLSEACLLLQYARDQGFSHPNVEDFLKKVPQ